MQQQPIYDPNTQGQYPVYQQQPYGQPGYGQQPPMYQAPAPHYDGHHHHIVHQDAHHHGHVYGHDTHHHGAPHKHKKIKTKKQRKRNIFFAYLSLCIIIAFTILSKSSMTLFTGIFTLVNIMFLHMKKDA